MVNFFVIFCVLASVIAADKGNDFREETIFPGQYLERQADPASACLREHNKYRMENNKPNLTPDNKLVAAARKHNQLMADTRCFSHQCTGEPKLGQRVTNEGYVWSSAGENIAGGQRSCGQVMDKWIKSDGHRRNILGDFKNVGCHFVECNKSNCQYKTYWTCVFGTPR